MTKTEIEQYLYKHIPITKALGVKAVAFSQGEVKFEAPLSKNINHRSTAFGGSISSLLITTCWSYLRLLLDEIQPIPRIVIGRSETKYLKPISSDFTAKLMMPAQQDVALFMETFQRFGKARIELSATIEQEGDLAAKFQGNFVAIKQKS